MKSPIMLLVSVALLFVGCKSLSTQHTKTETPEIQQEISQEAPLKVVFASCNDQDRPQPLWKPIIANDAHTFIWGGDNVYADTADLSKMKNDYQKVRNHPDYAALLAETNILGTWDDHDYGKNDAGAEWEVKEGAKTILLDFLGYAENDPLRKREGVYHSRAIETEAGSVKFILLDTRYFRSPLKESNVEGDRYMAWPKSHEGTVLGEKQWNWLEDELKDNSADFTVIVSSIQFLNYNHGWEKWGNFPSEVATMYDVLKKAKAKNIFFLSGDRHMAEVSVNTEAGLPYPLVVFTSSGLTHTWIDGATEANKYRVSNVVKQLNFGVLLFDFENQEVTFQIRGEDDFLYETFTQQY